MDIPMNSGIRTGDPEWMEHEYGLETVFAGWNPDVELLVHQRQCARANETARHAQLRCIDAEQPYLQQEQYPFAK